MKFSGKNFQAWPEFSVDIDGLTMVIGPSNEGKSSLCRALRGVLRNELDANYIRNPKDQPMELTLETGEHKVIATRSKKGSVKYDIDAEPFAKLDGEIPEKIRNLNFGEVNIGDFTIDPIFAEQNFPQFLIDSTTYKPSVVNAVLGAFGGTEKLEHGKKEANLRKTQKDGEARLLAGQIRDAEERKAKLVDMVAVGEAVGTALQGLDRGIKILEAEAHWYAAALQCRIHLAPLHQIITALVLPDMLGIEQLQQQMMYGEQAAKALHFVDWLHQPLGMIDKTASAWTGIVRLWKEVCALESVTDLQDGPMDTTALQSFNGLNAQCNELLVIQSSINHLSTAIALRRDLKQSVKQLTAIDEQFVAAQEEARKGLCTKCGKPLEHMCGAIMQGAS